MTKQNVPFFALLIGYAGALTNFLADAKSIIGAFAAVASLVASLYAIVISRERLKKLRGSRRRRAPFLKRFRKLIARCWLLVALLALSGCATQGQGDSPLAKLANLPARVLDKAATFVTATTTNIVEQAIVTANETVSLDFATQSLVTNITYATNVVLLTNMTATPRAAIVRTIDTAEAARTFLPPPYGEAAAAGLAIVSTLLAAAVKRRNEMLKTVIHGVEGSANKPVKENIAAASRLLGTARELHTLVKKLTVTKG